MSNDDVFGISVDGGVISLSGDLDAHTAPQLDDALDAVVGSGVDQVVLQMKEVGFVDSSGLRSMIRARNAGGQERTVVVMEPSSATLRLLEITGMTEHFTIEGAAGGDA